MTITIAHLRAAGMTAEQIVKVLELEQNERIAKTREQNRIRQQNHRSRNGVTRDLRDLRDKVPPSLPLPSMVPPITPSLTPLSDPPPSNIRAIANATRSDFEEFWKAYPRRDGANPKAPALKKFWMAIRQGSDPKAIIAGAIAYAAVESERVGTPYIAQAVTWLNQRRWEDYQRVQSAPVDKEKIAVLRARYEKKQAEQW